VLAGISQSSFKKNTHPSDVPLEEDPGEIVAKATVEHRFSAILDLSLFRKGQMAFFMAPFLEILPNYFSLIDIDSLKRLGPEAVTIIH
jgi:hypothetical protein